MQIMAKQVTNMVSRQCTQTGGKTLEELFRVHFPDTPLAHDSNDTWGQQSLDICKCTMNRENGTWPEM
jgi:hypothetical protein